MMNIIRVSRGRKDRIFLNTRKNVQCQKKKHSAFGNGGKLCITYYITLTSFKHSSVDAVLLCHHYRYWYRTTVYTWHWLHKLHCHWTVNPTPAPWRWPPPFCFPSKKLTASQTWWVAPVPRDQYEEDGGRIAVRLRPQCDPVSWKRRKRQLP